MKQSIVLFMLVAVLNGCSTLSTSQCVDLDRMTDQSIGLLIQENVGLQGRISSAPGYLMIDQKEPVVPVFGKVKTRGVLVDVPTGSRSYFNVEFVDFGGDWGRKSFNALILFKDAAHFADVRDGAWSYQFNAEEAGSVDKAYIYAEGDSSARYTLRAINMLPYEM